MDNDEPVGVLTGGGGPDVSVSVNWPYARAMDGLAGDRNAPDRAGSLPANVAATVDAIMGELN